MQCVTEHKFPLHLMLVYMNHAFYKGIIMHLSKSIDPCQSALSAQADVGRDFLLLVSFLHVKGAISANDLDSC